MDIRDELLIELKRLAAETRTTLRELIEEAIRLELGRRREGQRRGGQAQRALTFRGRGLQPGVNLDSMSELLDIMGGPS